MPDFIARGAGLANAFRPGLETGAMTGALELPGGDTASAADVYSMRLTLMN